MTRGTSYAVISLMTIGGIVLEIKVHKRYPSPFGLSTKIAEAKKVKQLGVDYNLCCCNCELDLFHCIVSMHLYNNPSYSRILIGSCL